MRVNRSMPKATVIPELPYADIGEAIDWLCGAFGFSLRLRIADHRAQLNAGDGAIVLTTGGRTVRASDDGASGGHSVMVRVEDVHAHHDRAKQYGARILMAPSDFPYGERQYSAIDLGGHYWTFSESIADVDPTSWGGTPGEASSA
jgi:uncharacterized glyoxalase superfamily protein PhnB